MIPSTYISWLICNTSSILYTHIYIYIYKIRRTRTCNEDDDNEYRKHMSNFWTTLAHICAPCLCQPRRKIKSITYIYSVIKLISSEFWEFRGQLGSIKILFLFFFCNFEGPEACFSKDFLGGKTGTSDFLRGHKLFQLFHISIRSCKK
jgi:hypothetical protein